MPWPRDPPTGIVDSVHIGEKTQAPLRFPLALDARRQFTGVGDGVGTSVTTQAPLRVPWKGAFVFCSRSQRDLEFKFAATELQRQRCCGRSRTSSHAVINTLEPIFAGEEWARDQKGEFLDRKKLRFLLPLLEEHERNNIKRYVFFDIGAREFSSSSGWFLANYPEAFRFEVVAFELSSHYVKRWRIDAQRNWRGKAQNLTIIQGGVSDRTADILINTNGMGNINMVAAGNDNSNEIVRLFNFSMFLQMHVRENDFVVVKMDVEGSEYNILPSLISSGSLGLIDELFLEAHYSRRGHRDLIRSTRCGAEQVDLETHSCRSENVCIHRQEAVQWIKLLRAACIHVHEWT